MINLLDSTSEHALIILCIVMSIVALFLAVAIFYEIIIKPRKAVKEQEVKLNIKNDEKDYCKNGHDGRGGYYV